MGMKVVIVSVTCHADGGEKGEVKLLAEGNVGVLVFEFAYLSIRMLRANCREEEEHNLVGVAWALQAI